MSAVQRLEASNFNDSGYPRFIKYMGSKSKIMDFVLEGINDVYRGGTVCDLFSGSASLAGALGQQCPVHSNDIQNYSSVLAQTYSLAYIDSGSPSVEEILEQAQKIVESNTKSSDLLADYSAVETLELFNGIEKEHQALLEVDFSYEWHLFAKNYSGTWWSYEQCLWIDAIREVAEKHREQPWYSAILSSLMFAMAYTSQGTGHYAQYRDAKTASSLKDILIYRKRKVQDYFEKKYVETLSWIPSHKPNWNHKVTSLDYTECLANLDGGTVYADPPYCFVHYSRFYHALETLVLYDFPNLQIKGGKVVKGRYREGRHQSPFCIKTKVKGAFEDLFNGVARCDANLVLSYSNTGMISIEEMEALALHTFKGKTIELLLTDHQHMTLGRQKDRHREVQECLLLVK